jgi:hypothetical protein
MSVLFRNIPTRYEDGTWGYTRFPTREDFRKFVEDDLFKGKRPGLYNLDETSVFFNEHARYFIKNKMFTDAPAMSKDYIDYWDGEREKCRKGVIFHGKNGKIWYLPRYFYHWLNFLQIYNTEHDRFEFPGLRDVQYHMALYEMCAELNGKHCAIVKKRQMASSYFHIARIYNRYIFEEGFTAVIGASDKKYINNTKGCWKFLNQYYNFTSKHTAWAHINSPNKVYEWQQQAEEKTPDGRRIDTGTHATITGVSFDQDPVGGVGGACKEFFYEEGGVAPTADQTLGFMKSAMRQGTTVTGIFIIAGSVGQLDQCEPIKNFLKRPDAYDIYAVDTDLIDEHGTKGRTALFIPEQWSLTGEGELNFTDKWGNSKVEEALTYLNKEYARLKSTMLPDDYQLEISQRPRNIDEAFAMRTQSIFPVQHTASQIRRIEENEYALEYVDLIRTEKNKIETPKSDRRPIMEFPCPMDMEDKRGVCVMHEPPIPGAPNGTYIATFDPVETGATTTSASLASLRIYKMDVEVIDEIEVEKPKTGKEGFRDMADEWGPIRRPQRPNEEVVQKPKVTSHLEGGKEVFFWTGRFDDPDKTNEYVSMALELYNARCMCEKNKPGFISYMRSKRRHKYLALGKEMTFDKDLDIATTSREPYGVGMTPKLKKVLLSYAVDSLSEVVFEDRDKDDNVVAIQYGVEKIRDIMLLKEMQLYQDGVNVDRIISYIILQGWIKSLQASGLIRKKVEKVNNNLEKSEKVVVFKGSNNQLFSNIGRGTNGAMSRNRRTPFRNIK